MERAKNGLRARPITDPRSPAELGDARRENPTTTTFRPPALPGPRGMLGTATLPVAQTTQFNSRKRRLGLQYERLSTHVVLFKPNQGRIVADPQEYQAQESSRKQRAPHTPSDGKIWQHCGPPNTLQMPGADAQTGYCQYAERAGYRRCALHGVRRYSCRAASVRRVVHNYLEKRSQ